MLMYVPFLFVHVLYILQGDISFSERKGKCKKQLLFTISEVSRYRKASSWKESVCGVQNGGMERQ